jgi:hypothetical protein
LRQHRFSLDQGVSDDRQQEGDPQPGNRVVQAEPISLALAARCVLGREIARPLPYYFGGALLECEVPSVAMASLQRGERRRCSGDIRGALDFMGAYATPPGDINASAPASGMPRGRSTKDMIWNKELTICPRAGRSSTRTVAMQQRVFPHHPCTVADDPQTRQ